MERKSVRPNEKLNKPLIQQDFQPDIVSITFQRPTKRTSKLLSKSKDATRAPYHTKKSHRNSRVEIQKFDDIDLKGLRLKAQTALEQINNQHVRNKLDRI